MKNISNSLYQRVGACALVSVLMPSHLIVANSGDCEGVLLGSENPLKINERLNAG